jgi:hypothetical protein
MLRAATSLLLVLACLSIPASGHSAVTAFRLNDLDFRDPHFFVTFISCTDVTDTPIVGFSMNGLMQTSIQTDGDTDGLLDFSMLIVFDPADASLPGGTLRFSTNVACTAPLASTSCTANSPLTNIAYTNQAVGTCLGTLAGTVRPYAPAVSTPSAPCFVTNPSTITLALAGTPVPLHDAQFGGTYVGTPPATIVNGLLRGFLTAADANATILPASIPLIGGHTLASILRGGAGNCSSSSDMDTHPSLGQGWWVYANFPAVTVPFTDPTTDVGDLGPGVFLGAAMPNPFGRQTTIEYTLPIAGAVRLSVHDIQGRHVVDLERRIQSPGHHVTTWSGLDANGQAVESGVYFARIEALGRSAMQRIVLLR